MLHLSSNRTRYLMFHTLGHYMKRFRLVCYLLGCLTACVYVIVYEYFYVKKKNNNNNNKDTYAVHIYVICNALLRIALRLNPISIIVTSKSNG